MTDYTSWSMEDGVQFLVMFLRQRLDGPTNAMQISMYGYDLHVDNLANHLWEQKNQFEYQQGGGNPEHLKVQTRVLYDAAWFLVNRGVLRQGVKYAGQQNVDGLGLSLTPFGNSWIKSASDDDFLVADGSAMQKRFAAHSVKLGPGYLQRANEAVTCFQAHAYLGCCAMCGAAAESILLALASAKTDDPEKTVKEYGTSSGRTLTLNKIIGKADGNTKRIFEAFVGLLSYWRDESAHGKHTQIGPDEAAVSLIELLRFAMVADKRWTDFTSN